MTARNASRPSRRWGARVRLLLLPLLALFLGACKIVILVPPGGKVVSANGEICEAGQTCVIDVTDDTYDDTFSAMPASGYSFAGWEKDNGYFCGGKGGDCRLYTTGFTGNPGLMSVLGTDREFYLIPRFEPSQGYNWAYWKRVLHQVDTGSHSGADFLYAIAPIVGQCDPGAITAAAAERTLRAVNETRALHQLPPVEYDPNFDMQMQLTSLVQRANEYLSHFPQSGDTCFTVDAEMGAASANLSGGSGGVSDPVENVIGWTNDNRNVSAVMEAGHRRWVLFPELGYTAYGQVDGYASLKVFDFNRGAAGGPAPGLDFVALPYGNYPYVFVSGGSHPTPWSLSMIPDSGSGNFDYFSQATVSVVQKQGGQALNVHSVHSDSKGFGLANFLSWLVDGWEYDTAYRVTVSGIRMPGGDVRELAYDVALDRFNLFTVDKPLEAGDSLQGSGFSGTFEEDRDADSYRLDLSGTVSFSKSQGFFLLVYDADKQLVVSSDAAFSMSFPAGTYTVVASPCDETGLCYQDVTAYNASFQ